MCSVITLAKLCKGKVTEDKSYISNILILFCAFFSDQVHFMTFLQLIAEFQRLGSKIVCADFSRILVSTRKRTVDDAMSYVEYVNNSILGKDLFHSLVLSVNQVSLCAMMLNLKKR